MIDEYIKNYLYKNTDDTALWFLRAEEYISITDDIESFMKISFIMTRSATQCKTTERNRYDL